MSDCHACADAGRKGYCAPGRCYCAHPDCHAFASWSPLPAIPDATPIPASTRPTRDTSWDDREDESWIDKL